MNRLRKNRGFTLLEVLIATVVFTVAVAVIISLFSAGLIGESDVENRVIAMNLAQQRLEEVRNLAFVDIVDEAKTAVTGFSGFEREVDQTESPTGLKQVTVAVYWMHNSDEVSVSAATYISEL